jgi:hypothetical protein
LNPLLSVQSWIINHFVLVTNDAITAMPKLEDDQYIDGMSPPSSANESETLHSISLSTNPANFQSKFPAAMSDFEHDEDEDSFMDDEEMGIDSHEERSGTVSLPESSSFMFLIRLPNVYTPSGAINRS